MNYVGKHVYHKAQYGEGTIISCDSKGHIVVRFPSLEKDKVFPFPKCFQTHLEMLDKEAAAELEKELHIKLEDEKKKEVIKHEKVTEIIMSSKSSASGIDSINPIHVPTYPSVTAFVEEQKNLLASEIAYIKKNGGKKVKLLNGKPVEKKSSVYIYSFESDSELTYPDNTQVTIWLPGHSEGIPGIIVNCEEFTVIIASMDQLDGSLSIIEFSSDPWRLLRFLQERLTEITIKKSPIVRALICEGKKKIEPSKKINKGQDTACKMSAAQPITFVWGPPGTGKTETLAKIAVMHLKKKHRVLMLSYSNVSVDGAVWRVFNKAKGFPEGTIVRYGYPKDKDLLQHPFLTSHKLILKKYPALLQEREALVSEKKKVAKDSIRYVEISERLSAIKAILNDEEKIAVKKASFVATTVSKAIADRTIYKDIFDVVIFDEASMAYIPQIVFAASLAGSHFVCMGDFAQLPPIVQSSSSSPLNVDIFNYCGIVGAVNAGYSHQWLCMLDVQYRMHPTIAAFASNTMYSGLLKSGPGIGEKRKPIVGAAPFSGKSLYLVDLSGMLSVCIKTADQSRINILSAFVAMGLAVNAAKQNEVGIISPYNAQSRLLHAMARDIAERFPDLKSISCATVHQFQGSEKDVIIYDAVDCYRMTHPGVLLTSTTNDYANRLYNVAVTRSRGKMISVVNVDYMKEKKLSNKLIFRKMINSMLSLGYGAKGKEVLQAADSSIVQSFEDKNAWDIFMKDLADAKSMINIDLPGTISEEDGKISQLVIELNNAKKKGVKVFVRADNKNSLPKILQPLSIKGKFITNPVTVIDKKTVWYGMPASKADFLSDGIVIPTKHRPAMRFSGRNFAQAVYGFLEMNHTLDEPDITIAADVLKKKTLVKSGNYDTFASYVAGELKCSICKGPMKLKKSGKGKFFLGCSNYPKCTHTELVKEDDLENYFYYKNPNGKHCPVDNTSLQAKMGPYGLYVCCCNELKKHYYKFDQI